MEQPKASPLGLSTSQAAHALGVSLGTIRRWSDMGHLESYRTPGGQRRFSREQIEQFVDSLQRGARPNRAGNTSGNTSGNKAGNTSGNTSERIAS